MLPPVISKGLRKWKPQCKWSSIFTLLWAFCQSLSPQVLAVGRYNLGNINANTSSASFNEFLKPFKNTQQICQHFGFAQRPSSDRTPLIFDFFLASQERDMMEIRLRELEHVVDIFVPVESRVTFTGLWKPLVFPTVYRDLPGFVIGKIRYLVLDHLPGDGAWAREHHHRGALLQLGLKSPGISPGEGDILLISDADEIPKPMFLYALKHCSGAVYPHSMQTMLHYYSFNRRLKEGKSGSSWAQPKAMLYSAAGPYDAQALRDSSRLHVYMNTSWHCSSCFNTISAIVTKLQSFSHTEADTEANRDPKTIVERVRSGNDLMGRVELWGPDPFEKIAEDQLDLPRFIMGHPTRFSYLISRDSADTGFLDLDLHIIGHHHQEEGNTTDDRYRYSSRKRS